LVWVLSGAIWGGAAMVGALGLVFLSGSRGALLALVPLLISWWISASRVWKWVALGIAVVGIIVFASGRFRTAESLANSRTQIWQVAQKAFQQAPFTGIGIDNFGEYYVNNRPMDVIAPDPSHAHNLLLHLLAESGLIGLAAFCVLWGAVIVYLVRARAWPMVTLLSSAFLLNIFDYTWFSVYLQYALWVGVASIFLASTD
jgi:O-antigen ligase